MANGGEPFIVLFPDPRTERGGVWEREPVIITHKQNTNNVSSNYQLMNRSLQLL